MKIFIFFAAIIYIFSVFLMFAACNRVGGNSGAGNDGEEEQCSITAGGSCVILSRDGKSIYFQPGYWKDNEWVGLINPNGEYDGCVNSVVIKGKDIYAGGYCADRYDVRHAGYWKNGSWKGLTNKEDVSSDAVVNSILFCEMDLIAGGYCINNNGIKVPGCWLDGSWLKYKNSPN